MEVIQKNGEKADVEDDRKRLLVTKSLDRDAAQQDHKLIARLKQVELSVEFLTEKTFYWKM